MPKNWDCKKGPKGPFLIAVSNLTTIGVVMSHCYYVYEGVEVIKTGRIATKKVEMKVYSGVRVVEEVVHEITPIPRPGEHQWKRWVRESELFTIQETDGTSEEFPVVGLDNTNENNVLNDILSSMRRPTE